jgi:anti-anti-sigma factor
MGLSTSRSTDGSELTIAVDGRFDFNLHSDFRNAYRDLPPETRFVIDLRDTTFMDSSAMGMLLLLREHAGEKSANIRLLNCSPDVRKVLKISNLDKIFAME